MERLHDRIVWKAEKVAYDEITTYRRDQILSAGVSPVDYTRSDWTNAFDPKDDSPVIESVKFRKKLEPWRLASSLTKDDLQLDPNSPAAGLGPDLTGFPRHLPLISERSPTRHINPTACESLRGKRPHTLEGSLHSHAHKSIHA